jgi:pimeloyl-ACP methyl ester carboxylesterase
VQPPAVDGVEHRTVTVAAEDGPLDLHVALAGDPEAPPVLLLHGWPQHWFEWRKVIGLLSDRFRLVAHDHRGFGWSTARGDRFDPETFASDAVALLDALGIERAGVVGHDWGGFTSYVLALRYPSRVAGIVPCSTPQPWVEPSLDALWRAWYAPVMATLGPELLVRPRAMARILGAGAGGYVFSDAEVEAYGAVLRQRPRARATALLYRSYLRLAAEAVRTGHGPYDDLELTVPARGLTGTNDLAISVRAATAGPADVEAIEGAGHWIPEEHPDRVAAVVGDLLG